MNNYFVHCGSGEPLILLHGNGEDHSCFKNQIGVFANFFEVFAIDTRGHGLSPRGSGKFTLERFAEDLRVFMEKRNIEKAHILGFSDGANIAMIFASRYPQKLKSLILNGGNAFPGGLKAYFNYPCQVGYRLLKPLAVRLKRVRFTELLGLMALEPQLTAQDLRAIAVPTLVLAGTKDVVKREHTQWIAAMIDNSRLVFLEGGHMLCEQCPEAYNKTVLRFLKNQKNCVDSQLNL